MGWSFVRFCLRAFVIVLQHDYGCIGRNMASSCYYIRAKFRPKITRMIMERLELGTLQSDTYLLIPNSKL